MQKNTRNCRIVRIFSCRHLCDALPRDKLQNCFQVFILCLCLTWFLKVAAKSHWEHFVTGGMSMNLLETNHEKVLKSLIFLFIQSMLADHVKWWDCFDVNRISNLYIFLPNIATKLCIKSTIITKEPSPSPLYQETKWSTTEHKWAPTTAEAPFSSLKQRWSNNPIVVVK